MIDAIVLFALFLILDPFWFCVALLFYFLIKS